MSTPPVAPQARPAHRPLQAAFLQSYSSSSPLAMSHTDINTATHEFEPDVDADGLRRAGHTPELQSRPGSQAAGHPRLRPRSSFTDSRPVSATFEHESDADADGYRHPHEKLMQSPMMRALPEATVPLDPRAGKVIITPSPLNRDGHHAHNMHHEEHPYRSIEDFQDPIELHSHAHMIYGIDESKARETSVPDWMEGDAHELIEEASHGALNPPTIPYRPVANKLPVEPTGIMMASVGGIAGDREPVGLTRIMEESEMRSVPGAYTKDGEGSAGLPYDENTSSHSHPAKIVMHPEDEKLHGLTERDLQRPQPGAELAAFRSHMGGGEHHVLVEPGAVPDNRPEWLRAAELMGNNDYAKLSQEHLLLEDTASPMIENTLAPQATLARDNKVPKLARGPSYPSIAYEGPEKRDRSGSIDVTERQGVSHRPEKDLFAENPPVGTEAREIKFALETESPTVKAEGVPDIGVKFMGLNAEATKGASVPAAALMNTTRNEKSQNVGETAVPTMLGDPQSSDLANIPQPPAELPETSETITSIEHAKLPSIPARPSSRPTIPPRPQREASVDSTSTKEDANPNAPARASSINRSEMNASPKPVAPKGPSKPAIPVKPVVGKITGTLSAFASALEAKLKGGPPTLTKKESSTEEHAREEDGDKEAAPAALTDVRKGRARGPAKRKPATVLAPEHEGGATSTSIGGEENAVTDVGDSMTSRFGVEMRSVGCQTGVISIMTTAGRRTVMEGAGVQYPGQTVVVDYTDEHGRRLSKSEARAKLRADSGVVSEPSDDATNSSSPETEGERVKNGMDGSASHEGIAKESAKVATGDHHEIPTVSGDPSETRSGVETQEVAGSGSMLTRASEKVDSIAVTSKVVPLEERAPDAEHVRHMALVPDTLSKFDNEEARA